MLEWKRLRQIAQVAGRGLNVSGRAQTIEGAPVGKRTQERHRASPVRDLDGLPALDLPEQLARALP